MKAILAVLCLMTVSACGYHSHADDDYRAPKSTVQTPEQNEATLRFREQMSAMSHQEENSDCKRPNLMRDGVCLEYDPDDHRPGYFSSADQRKLEMGCQILVEGWYFLPNGRKSFARDWSKDCGRDRVSSLERHNPVLDRYQAITCTPAPLSRRPVTRPKNGWKSYAKVRKARSRGQVATILTGDPNGESRVSSKVIRSHIGSVTGLCWSSVEQFHEWFTGPDVEEVACTAELISKLHTGRTDSSGEVFDFNSRRSVCLPGEMAYRWNGIYFLLSACINPVADQQDVAIQRSSVRRAPPELFSLFLSLISF